MPYALKNNCVIRSDTGATVKCHSSRTRAKRHLAALMANVPEAKAQADADTGKAPVGRKKLSRAEAARHASLVRWKKESPFAANVQERLAQIRAKRMAKGKGRTKGKAKGGKGKTAKPAKQTPEQRQQAKEQQAAANRSAALGKLQSKPNAVAMEALDGLRKGGTIDADMAESLAGETGLVQKHKDGSYSLSPSGKQFLNALDKGDVAAASTALSSAGDKLAKQDEQAQRKAEREQARAERAKARETRKKARGKGKPPADDKEKQADRAQRQKEHEEDRAAALADREQRQKEHAEDRAQRAKDRAQRAKEHAEDRAQRAKDRAERAAERKRKATTPKPTPGPTRRTTKAMEYTMDELTPIIADMQATLEELTEVAEEEAPAIKAGRRNNSGDQATIDQGYELAMQLCDLFASLGADTGEEGMDEEEHEMMGGMEGKGYILDGSAVKALDGDRVGAFAVRFGSEQEPDMSQMHDYFTKSTDFWLDAWDRRPMLYHHAMDEDTDDAPRIGTWTKAEVKDEGVWLEGQLDRHHRYYTAIKELVRRGALRLSSDSAPHLVRRSVKTGGIHEVTRWPLLAASLTPTPAEPRLTAVSFKALLAELGVSDISDNPEVGAPDTHERPDAAQVDADRARRLLLRARLLALQE